jgi:hypothetical protein
MEVMRFDKQRALQLANAFQVAGEQITPIGDSWTIDDILQLCGAAIVAATVREMNVSYSAFRDLPGEYQEAKLQTRYDDLFTAIEFFADMTALAYQGGYDERFDGRVTAALVRDGDKRAIEIESGDKN